MNGQLAIDREKVADFCRRHRIQGLAIFGSALRDDFGPGHVPDFFRLSDVAKERSDHFAGRQVDLRTPEDLSRYFRGKVVAEAEVQYARG
ncbi:MAG: hypothetical protein JSW27_06785 [Phycisphaerales bacterium]|nr:MAG: hypothetical protein JSW27_06785 [Phycisphaerales bacterium]